MLHQGPGHDGDRGFVGEPLEDIFQDHGRLQRFAITPNSIAAYQNESPPLQGCPPRPYVPPTAAERTAEAFDARKAKSPREKLDYTLVEAARESTRPLLLFGAPEDPACVDLFRLLNESAAEPAPGTPKTPADLRWEFELATFDAAAPDVIALARDLKVPLGDGDKTPTLAVLAAAGRLAEAFPLRPGPGGKLDAPAIAAFLARHKLPTRDAEAMLADGLARAKAEHKRVFLILSASWCGPCRLLARFLAANKSELNRHYVFIKLDVSRDDHAGPLRERYKGANSGGVPWYAILDDAGNPLVTSNAKALEEEEGGNSNVGFPSSKEGIDHYLAMLRQTAPGLTDEALATLRVKLGGKP